MGGRGGGQHDGYWRLLSYEAVYSVGDMGILVQRRSLTPDSRLADGLNMCLQRSDRGLLNYQKCNSDELRGFLHARGFADLVPKRLLKPGLIKTLHQADDNMVFSKLMDLPPELRNICYEFYVAGFSDEPLIMPALPPLARVDKTLCKEVRPIFFKNCIFRIDLLDSRKACLPWQPHRDRMLMTIATTLFFKQLDPMFLGMIRRLQIFIKLHDGTRAVDLVLPDNDDRDAVEVVTAQTRGYGGPGLSQMMLSRGVEARIGAYGKNVLSREEGSKRLVLEDVYGLRGTVEAGMAYQVA